MMLTGVGHKPFIELISLASFTETKKFTITIIAANFTVSHISSLYYVSSIKTLGVMFVVPI